MFALPVVGFACFAGWYVLCGLLLCGFGCYFGLDLLVVVGWWLFDAQWLVGLLRCCGVM